MTLIKPISELDSNDSAFDMGTLPGPRQISNSLSSQTQTSDCRSGQTGPVETQIELTRSSPFRSSSDTQATSGTTLRWDNLDDVGALLDYRFEDSPEMKKMSCMATSLRHEYWYAAQALFAGSAKIVERLSDNVWRRLAMFHDVCLFAYITPLPCMSGLVLRVRVLV